MNQGFTSTRRPSVPLQKPLRGPDDSFYRKFGALHQIDPALTVEIADFGHGSDSPIALDFQNNREAPQVIRLFWPGEGQPNYWEIISPDFDSFAKAIGLRTDAV